MSQDLSEVIQGGLCVGCGACVAVDPTIELRMNPVSGQFEPSRASGPEAASVCPAVRVDYGDLHERLFGVRPDSPFGVVERVVLAQSTDRSRNARASSGGLIRELLLDLLVEQGVAGAIVLDHEAGLEFRPRLVRRPEEIESLPGSIYIQVCFDEAIRILEAAEKPLALVAIPCQLEGVYQYIFRRRPELVSRIHTTLGLMCGWMFSHHAARAICRFKGVDFDSLQTIAFRGQGPRGLLRLATPDREVLVSRQKDFDYRVAFDRMFNLPRCHLCVNHLNYLAEIVVGDAWLTRTQGSRTGVSLVAARTRRAADWLDRLVAQGRIRAANASPDDLIESKARPIVMGDLAYAYADYRRARGLPCPELEGPNRPFARPLSLAAVEGFHREFERRRGLQQAGRYRTLWWRKLILDYGLRIPGFAWRRLGRVWRRASRATGLASPGSNLPPGFE